MVVTVVADGAITDVSTVSPAGITASQILAPNFLQQVSSERGCVPQLRRRDHLHRLDQYRILPRQQIGFGDLRQFRERANLHAALRVFFDVSKVADLLDVDEVCGRLLQSVFQPDQQVRSTGVNSRLVSVERQYLDRFLYGRWSLD